MTLIEKLFKDGKFNDRGVRALSDDERNQILERGPSTNIVEAIYWIKNNLTEYPKKCKVCNNKITKFISFSQAYAPDYCSSKCSNSAPEVVEKRRAVSRVKYGTDFPLQSVEIKEKIAKKQQDRNIQKSPSIREEIEAQGFVVKEWNPDKLNNPALLTCTAGHDFQRQVEGWYRWYITCPKCSKTRSRAEVEIEDYIVSLGVDVQQINKRKLIGNRTELDIFVPSHKLGIEYNGLYFHSTNKIGDSKAKFRHITKQDAAENSQIKLFQIWESEWRDKREIVKSRIAHALGKSSKIFARKCTAKSIDSRTAKDFLNTNHIQGECVASVNLGLFLDSSLVAVMTFGKPRFLKTVQWELLRYCTSQFISVVGGAAKLLSYFKRQYLPESIISYADRRWSQGDLYKKLGFTLTRVSPPGYYYFGNTGLEHRLKFQKHKLEKLLPQFDKNKTEEDNMFLNGYRKLWDCGNLVFTWRNNDTEQ